MIVEKNATITATANNGNAYAYSLYAIDGTININQAASSESHKNRRRSKDGNISVGKLPSGSVGLSVATGATSRRISYGVGMMFILLAFLPKIAALFAIMPKPVMGVILLIEISFVLPTGMQICSSRMLDARKIFVIGLSFAFGMAIEIIPDFYMVLPEWL